MPETSVHDQLVELMALSDDMIEHFTKEQMVETARLLAANLVEYQRHFGMLPANPSLKKVTPGTVTEDQELFIVETLENLISVLGAVKSIEQAGDVGHDAEPLGATSRLY